MKEQRRVISNPHQVWRKTRPSAHNYLMTFFKRCTTQQSRGALTKAKKQANIKRYWTLVRWFVQTLSGTWQNNRWYMWTLMKKVGKPPQTALRANFTGGTPLNPNRGSLSWYYPTLSLVGCLRTIEHVPRRSGWSSWRNRANCGCLLRVNKLTGHNLVYT